MWVSPLVRGKAIVSGPRVLNVDDPEVATVREAAPAPASAPRLIGVPHQVACVICTAGSIGRPKGAAVSHARPANLAAAQVDRFAVIGSSRLLQFASMTFDAACRRGGIRRAGGGGFPYEGGG
ncbi:AMP-binding protein [Streptomyces sp. NPDC051572]|uniref:AMP-binding protein n=1 Tax=Streptomyces sp. NPDC051572 TaxID=3155802 RepID=UPI00344D991F